MYVPALTHLVVLDGSRAAHSNSTHLSRGIVVGHLTAVILRVWPGHSDGLLPWLQRKACVQTLGSYDRMIV